MFLLLYNIIAIDEYIGQRESLNKNENFDYYFNSFTFRLYESR